MHLRDLTPHPPLFCRHPKRPRGFLKGRVAEPGFASIPLACCTATPSARFCLTGTLMAGRKTKLTPERQKIITDVIAAGNYARTAVAMAGISEETYYQWLKKNPEFAEAVRKAESQAEAVRVARIARAGQEGNWTADAWWLERRFPDKWSRRERLEHTGANGEELKIRIHWGRIGVGLSPANTIANEGDDESG